MNKFLEWDEDWEEEKKVKPIEKSVKLKKNYQ